MLVFAADTIVRFRNGRILVHTTSSPLPAFETDQPMLVGWIARFVAPTDADAAIAVLPSGDRAGAGDVIGYLTRSGVLVTTAATEASERTAADSAKLTRNHLRLLARSVYDLACDVLGLGPEVAERALTRQTGIGLERRLIAALASVDGLRNELLQLRRPRMKEQLALLGVDSTAKGLQLHMGCGPGHLPGWINIDIYPAPLAMNVLWGLPFPDGSASRVFVSHLLEHLFFPRDVRFILAELKRVLAPGGVVRIVVPDVEQCIAAYAANDGSFFASRRETWSWWPENATRLEDFLAYAGAGAEPAYLFEAHKYGYDFETLAKVLSEAGFERARVSAYMASEDPALRVDYVSAVAKAQYGDRYYSLFVEANAPRG
ncbi:MAG: class I SAM-dependent methyltransferase [Steroidobacteraceae bacterium]